MARRARMAVLGGTFDRLHAGHEALLAAAFRHGQDVAIGLTTPRYLSEHPKRRGHAIRPFELRRRSLARYLSARYPGRRYRIVPLDDPFGGSLAPSVRLLVASAESRKGAAAVNKERRRRGLVAVRIVLVPLVRADDLLPVSSTRIRLGLIDAQGQRRVPLRVALIGPARLPATTVASAFQRALPRVPQVVVTRVRAPPGSAASPGPSRALEFALCAARQGEYGVGLATTPRGAATGWMSIADPSGAVGPPSRVRAGDPALIASTVARLLRSRRARKSR